MFDVRFPLFRFGLLILPLACAPAVGGQPTVGPTLELEAPSKGGDSAAFPAPSSETKPRVRPELTPCSEDNPGGCRAPTPPRDELDRKRRYSVEIRVDDPSLGAADASVTLVVFSDYQCPFCSRLEPVLAELRSRFPKQLRVIWKDLPLSVHQFAMPAALLAREAFIKYGNERFWHVHSELFLHQSEFDDAWFAAFAKAERLTWPADVSYQPRVEQSVAQADELSVAATPTLFINGRPIVGAEHISVYTDLVNEELVR
jgi:hypothetical protein